MDIALTLDKLVPGGDWQGSVTGNTKKDFDNIRWVDTRIKPIWKETQTKWAEIEPKLIFEKSCEDKIEAEILAQARTDAIKSLQAKGELLLNYGMKNLEK